MPLPARFLLALSLGAAIVAFAVAGLSQAVSPFGAPGSATLGSGADGQAGADESSSNADDDQTARAGLFVRIQLPASVQPGGSRQVRLGIEDRPVRAGLVERVAATEQMFAIEIDVVAADGTDGMAWITPNRVLINRQAVPWTRFDLTLRNDVPCGSDIGELRVRVRDLGDDTLTGERVVELPPVLCVDPPSQAPTSVHDTETDCGGGIQETRRVPGRSADGTSTTCRLPRSPRPATRQPTVDDGSDEVDEDDLPEDETETDDPDPSDAPDGNGSDDDGDPSGERDEPAPPPSDNGTQEPDESSEGSASTSESFEERAGSP